MKKNVTAVIIAILIVALVFISHPLWCSHDFEKVGEYEATCETAGIEYRRCQKCGLKREKEIKPLGHDMKHGKVDYSLIFETVFKKETYVCSRCGYSETGAESCCGDFKEYCAKIGTGFWLVTNKLATLDTDKATATLVDDDYYKILGVYRTVIGDNVEHLLLAN